MKITKSRLQKIARALLDFLDNNKISSLKDLEQYLGKTFPLSERNRRWIEISLMPSNLGTEAYTISFIWSGIGIPLETRINSELNYAQVIVKAKEIFGDYMPFAVDKNGNVAQYKYLQSADVYSVKEELRRLS